MATSQQGLTSAEDAASIADRMCDCNQRMANATKEISAAVSSWDNPRLQRALNEFNAAVDEFNAAYDEYYDALARVLQRHVRKHTSRCDPVGFAAPADHGRGRSPPAQTGVPSVGLPYWAQTWLSWDW